MVSRFSLTAVLAVASAMAFFVMPAAATKPAKPKEGRYIVVLEGAGKPGVARAHAGRKGLEVGHVYRSALNGYSARLTAGEVADLRRDPAVRAVERDARIEVSSQIVTRALHRTFFTPTLDGLLDLDGVDDKRVDVDVAVLDTGVDHHHPDLNVVGRVDCVRPDQEGPCVADKPYEFPLAGGMGGHGTAVAAIVGARDNDTGILGVAPGARIWDVRVLGENGPGWGADVLAGIDWVTAHSGEIEVANIGLACKLGACPEEAFDEALGSAVDSGIVAVAPAGNAGIELAANRPAAHPDVITVSGIADFDGQPGGLEDDLPCNWPGNDPEEEDDTLAEFSNYGPAIDIAAPAVCNRGIVPFVYPNGTVYYEGSGTSGASPQVAGAAALLASRDNPNSRADVEEIRETLLEEGNHDWVDDSGDGIHEPLLDISNDEVFDPVTIDNGPWGWDRDIRKRCLRTTGTSLDVNYFEDTTDCQASNRHWLATVNTSCAGAPTHRGFELNASGSPATINWYAGSDGWGPKWTVQLKVDQVNNTVPTACAPDDSTKVRFVDQVGPGGPLPHPHALITSHEVFYAEWRPTSGSSTRAVVGATFVWGGDTHVLEVNLHSGNWSDTHPDDRVLSAYTNGNGDQHVVLDGPEVGVSVPLAQSHWFWVDWNELLDLATEQGWFAPRQPPMSTVAVYLAAQAQKDAIVDLWTVDFNVGSE